MKKNRSSRLEARQLRKGRIALIFMIPALAAVALFMVYPIVYSVFLAFFDWDGVSAVRKFVGLDNFRRLVNDGFFWRALINTSMISVVAFVFQVFLGLVIAYCIVRIMTVGKGLYVLFYLVPTVVSEIAIALLWSFIYNPYFGIINSFLNSVGLSGMARGWLGDPATAFPAVINAMNLTYLGLYIVLFVAAIQDIPETIFDAAAIDGAGHARSFFSVTVPMMWDSIRSALLLCAVFSFKTFTLVYVLTQGGPSHSSEVLSTYLFKSGFNAFDMGYASAIACAQLIVTVAIGFILVKTSGHGGAHTA